MGTLLNAGLISSCRSDHRAFGSSKKGREKTEKEEKMIVMKCQRLRPDKTFEEIEIELPVDIFNRVVAERRNIHGVQMSVCTCGISNTEDFSISYFLDLFLSL